MEENLTKKVRVANIPFISIPENLSVTNANMEAENKVCGLSFGNQIVGKSINNMLITIDGNGVTFNFMDYPNMYLN